MEQSRDEVEGTRVDTGGKSVAVAEAGAVEGEEEATQEEMAAENRVAETEEGEVGGVRAGRALVISVSIADAVGADDEVIVAVAAAVEVAVKIDV